MIKKSKAIPRGEILFTRRSIRLYKEGNTISDEQLHYLLDAAMCAPSARNRQPWHFVVTRRPGKLQELAQLHPYGKMLTNAALAVLVCGDSQLETTESYIIQACAAATQNLLLAAHAQGLGAVWLGVHPRTERCQAMRDFFQLPEHIIPVALISVGFPDETKPANQNFSPERVHEDKW